MNDAFLMGGVQRVRHLNGQLNELLDRNRLASDLMLQSMAFQEFHDDERLAVMLGDLVNRADVGMIESRRCSGLSLESFQGLRTFRECLRKKLQSYVPAEANIFCLVN